MMSELERAEQHLEAWYAAELAASTGQSYRIGSRQLTRANLSEIRKQITFWQREVSRLKGKGTRRVFRAVPRDF
jgi:hypothetical protein